MTLDMAQVYTDFSGLAAMRARAREDSDAALDQVARQFESLFLQMMLKSMRDASLGDGLLDSKQSEFYREMYDKQIAMQLSEQQGIGLADVIKRQLGSGSTDTLRPLRAGDYADRPIVPSLPLRPTEAAQASARSRSGRPAVALDGSPPAFIEQLRPLAEQAAAKLGIAPEALLAQAALETGWGKHVMRHPNGDSSHNLFGIKADARWSGERVQVSTLEYRDGVALKTRAGFRAYDSFEQSFADYVDFVQRNPRYGMALQSTGDPRAYFQALQDAGYATDPAYAEKIRRIFESEPMQSAARQPQEGLTTI